MLNTKECGEDAVVVHDFHVSPRPSPSHPSVRDVLPSVWCLCPQPSRWRGLTS
jgi:hypothetical protein